MVDSTVEPAPLLAVRGVTKAFGGLRVLRDVSLEVPAGTITGLIGPNGSGKSTLFDVVTGYLPGDSGEISFAGQAIAGLKPHEVSRRGLVRTFQLTRIFPSLTVAENLLVFADHAEKRRRHGGGPAPDAGRPAAPGAPGRRPGPGPAPGRSPGRAREHAGEERAQEILEFVGLLRLAAQEAATLSYGQQKLLEIAQVLMLDPHLLLLDEPMAGINPGLAEELVGRLCELRARGLTLLLVEHNIPVIQQMCDTVAVLHAGRVMACGKPDEVLADREVREAFLGE
jgi:ABC-type branched-subunit amino acid transport system ATPase component